MKRTEISTGALLLFSIVFFFGGFSALAALFLSIAVHELGHISAIRLFGGRVQRLSVDVSGLCITFTGMTEPTKEIITLLSGPLAGLALAFAASYFGRSTQNTVLLKTAGLSLVLSLYNLLPALPLDGGRALERMTQCFFGAAAAKRLTDIGGVISGLGLCVLGLVFSGRMFGLALFGAGIVLLFAQTGLVKSFGMI